MRNDLRHTTLGDICVRLTDGSHNPPKGVDYSDYAMISSQNVCNGTIDFSKGVRFLSREDFEREHKRTRVSEGDVLLTIVGTVGRTAVVGAEHKNITMQRSVAVLTPNKDLVTSSYLRYILQAQSQRLISDAHGAAQKGIYLGALSKVELFVPSLSSQGAIVEELDCISKVIESKYQQLKELDALAQAFFMDSFGDPLTNPKGWNLRVLSDICSLKAGKGIKAEELSDEPRSGLYPCYGGNGIRGYIDRYLYDADAPIIGRQGALCGNVNYATAPFYATEHAVVVKSLVPMNLTWLFYLLKNLRLERFAHGAAQPGLSVQDLKPIEVPLPPVDLQQIFAEKVLVIEEQKELVLKSIKEFETLLAQRMEFHFA